VGVEPTIPRLGVGSRPPQEAGAWHYPGPDPQNSASPRRFYRARPRNSPPSPSPICYASPAGRSTSRQRCGKVLEKFRRPRPHRPRKRCWRSPTSPVGSSSPGGLGCRSFQRKNSATCRSIELGEATACAPEDGIEAGGRIIGSPARESADEHPLTRWRIAAIRRNAQINT
jgi:hypothetical protein